MSTTDELHTVLGGWIQNIGWSRRVVKENGGSGKFLEVEHSPAGDEVRISGNMQGLISFAKAVLEVAAKGIRVEHSLRILTK